MVRSSACRQWSGELRRRGVNAGETAERWKTGEPASADTKHLPDEPLVVFICRDQSNAKEFAPAADLRAPHDGSHDQRVDRTHDSEVRAPEAVVQADYRADGQDGAAVALPCEDRGAKVQVSVVESQEDLTVGARQQREAGRGAWRALESESRDERVAKAHRSRDPAWRRREHALCPAHRVVVRSGGQRHLVGVGEVLARKGVRHERSQRQRDRSDLWPVTRWHGWWTP